MTDPRHVLVERIWESDLLDSREDFTLVAGASGYELNGTTLIMHDGVRVEIAYRVEVASDWSTRNATIDIPALARNHRIEVPEPGIWLIDGERRTDLDGCSDIDLGWTPATNTIPVRRLELEGRNAATIRAAWLKWSELRFIATDQTYSRNSESTWQYASGDFSAELLVDDHGVVLRYGDIPIWREEVADIENTSTLG
jgi:uncharacterized protein